MRNRQPRTGPVRLFCSSECRVSRDNRYDTRAACRKLNQMRKKVNLDFEGSSKLLLLIIPLLSIEVNCDRLRRANQIQETGARALIVLTSRPRRTFSLANRQGTLA